MQEGFNTRAVQFGEYRDERVGNVTTPIFETSTFFTNQQEDAILDHTRGKPYMYTRWGNPTLQALESKYASLDQVEEALSFSSGMAAISSAIFSALKKGDRLLSIKDLYGETFLLFTKTLPSLGIDVDFASLEQLNRGEIDFRKYSAVYTESIINPTLGVSDLDRIGRILNELKIPFIVDATFASPFNQNPSKFGVDITVHSGTKYIGGHSDILLGLAGFGKEKLQSI